MRSSRVDLKSASKGRWRRKKNLLFHSREPHHPETRQQKRFTILINCLYGNRPGNNESVSRFAQISHRFFFGLKANPYTRNAIPSSPIGFRNLITFWRLSCAFFFACSVNFLWNEWRKIMRSGDVSNFSNKKSWGEELKMSCWSSFRFLRFQEITITETVNFLRISFRDFFRWSLWRFFMALALARRWFFERNRFVHVGHSLTTWARILTF